MNELEVNKAIESMRKELGSITTFVIAHRLSTIKEADRIIVLEKGLMVEDGNHDSILRDHPSGVYAKFVQQNQQSEQNQAQVDEKVEEEVVVGLPVAA